MIKVKGLTKDYGYGHGVFDVSFEVKAGETLGFLGPNGAGKSTTMRHLMGFEAASQGSVMVNGLDCRTGGRKLHKKVGYLPGEVALPEGLTGREVLGMMRGLKEMKGSGRLEELLKLFPVELDQNVKRLSIGEKRKLAVLIAFMDDPEVLLLDEPTSGLDPKMQEVFLEFVKEEKKRGKTILLSSHIFSEVDALCDRIMVIKEGHLVAEVDTAEIRHGRKKRVTVTLDSLEEYEKMMREELEIVEKNMQELSVSIETEDQKVNELIERLKDYRITGYREVAMTLEDYFMNFYRIDKKFGGVCS